MYMQGDREKEIGLTVSPLMDRRHKGGITRSQVRLSNPHHQDMPCSACSMSSGHAKAAAAAHPVQTSATYADMEGLTHGVMYCLSGVQQKLLQPGQAPPVVDCAGLARDNHVSLTACVLLQMGFFTIVGLPMFKAMADVFEGAKPMLEGVMGNYRAWEAAAAAADAAPT